MSDLPARLDAAERALAEVETPADAKALYDQLETLSQYARRFERNHARQNRIARLKLRTARTGGELLAETVRPGNPQLSRHATIATLPDGITRSMSSRWQALASIPEPTWTTVLDGFDEETVNELTLAYMLRVAKEFERAGKRAQNAELVARAPRIADIEETFPTIALDPPWELGDPDSEGFLGRSRPTYATMPVDEIAAQPIGDRANQNAHLYLWITNALLPIGFDLLEHWGFRYVTCLTWVKPSFGMGAYFRGSTEHVLFGIRGSLPLLRADAGTHFFGDRGDQHSSKPETFYQLVESCSPGPWFEWPARRTRAGWITSGAEVAAGAARGRDQGHGHAPLGGEAG